MKIVVTGATGVLGRHLLALLRGPGTKGPTMELIALSRHSRPAPSGVRALRSDYSLEHLNKVMGGCDAVVHLAASRSASAELTDHLPSLELADHVFRAAAAHGAHIVYASSISVYGYAVTPPWTETTPPAAHLPYGVLKYAAERLGVGYAARAGSPMASLRFGHLYGAFEDNNYLVNTLMRRAAQDMDLHLHAPARVRRDFTYAGDAAQGVVDALTTRADGVFNIGSGMPVTNAEIATAIVNGFGSRSRIIVDDPDATERVQATGMDLTHSAQVLGYHPRRTHVEAFREIAAKMGRRTRHQA